MPTPPNLRSILPFLAASTDRPSHSPRSDTRDITNDLCDPHNAISLDTRVAALLCIAATDYHLILESESRIAAIDLMVNHMYTRNYRRLLRNTDIRVQQRDIQLDFLVQTFRDAHNRFLHAFDRYQGIDKLYDFRAKLLKDLGTDGVKLAIIPLLTRYGDPVDLLRHSLSMAVDYTRAEATRAHDALNAALTALSDTRTSLKHSGSSLAQTIITSLETVIDDLSAHFKSSPYGQPAIIGISLRPRRYPLHVPELELRIPLELRNEGQGLATQVEISMTAAIGLNPVPASRVQLADVSPGSMLIELDAKTDPPEHNESALCDLRVWWTNVDTTDGERTYLNVTLPPQASNVDLSQIGNPYSSEPVTTQKLNSLGATTRSHELSEP